MSAVFQPWPACLRYYPGAGGIYSIIRYGMMRPPGRQSVSRLLFLLHSLLQNPDFGRNCRSGNNVPMAALLVVEKGKFSPQISQITQITLIFLFCPLPDLLPGLRKWLLWPVDQPVRFPRVRHDPWSIPNAPCETGIKNQVPAIDPCF